MTGLDTNVLVRHFTQDDPAQARIVERFFDAHADDQLFVGLPVLCELAWVLGSMYGYPREQIAGVVEAMLGTRQLVIEDHGAVRAAIIDFRSGKRDFCDYLIG